jgi:hypothetical protein
LVLAKVTLFQILPLKCSVKRFSVPWFRLCVYPELCAFVGQKKFDIIEMHGATTKINETEFFWFPAHSIVTIPTKLARLTFLVS